MRTEDYDVDAISDGEKAGDDGEEEMEEAVATATANSSPASQSPTRRVVMVKEKKENICRQLDGVFL